MGKALKPIVILGDGGYAQEVAWLLDDINSVTPQWNLLGFVDTVHSGKKEHYGLPVLGSYDEVAGRHAELFYACGMGKPAIREKESTEAEKRGWQPALVIHPSVIRAKTALLADGTIVSPGSVIGPNVRIGRHCVINMHVTVGHDAEIGDFSAVSPGAHIAGHVVLETGVFIGANASVGPGKRMGAHSSLAANSFLNNNLAGGNSALGVPAKVFFRSPASA